MRDRQHFDWWKEVFSKVASLIVGPRESLLLYDHEVVHEIAFGRPKEIAVVNFVDEFFVLECITTVLKRWRVCTKYGERGKWIANDILHDAEAFWEVSHDRSDFLRDRFIFLLCC